MALTYPKKYEKDINSANAEQQDLNGFLLYCIAQYTDSEYNNPMLWYCIKEDFVRWIKETWALIKKNIV